MTKLETRWVWFSFVLFALLELSASDANGMQAKIEPIAVAGTAPRGVSSNVPIRRFESMSYSGSGLFGLTVLSELSGSSVNETNDHLLIGAGFDFRAREGDVARGAPAGIRFGQIDPNFVSDGADTFFRSTLIGEQPDDVGVFSNWTLIARTGDAVPETEPGTTFADISTFQSKGSRVFGPSVFVRVELSGPAINDSNSQALYDLQDGTSRLIARAGDQVPSVPDGVRFASFEVPTSHNAFVATLVGPGVDESNDEVVIRRSRTQLVLVAREGDNVGETGVLGAINSIGYTPAEGIAFRAAVNFGAMEGSGIFFGSSGSAFALTGRIAPGTSGEARFLSFGKPTLNAQGTSVAFVADLDGCHAGQAIYVYGFGGPELIVRTGERFTNVDADVAISSFASESLIFSGSRIACVAFLDGEGVDESNNMGLIATNRYGDMVLIARTGNAIDVSLSSTSEDVRVIRGIHFDAGRRLQLVDVETLAFELSFTDGGNGIFVANPLGPVGDFDSDHDVDRDDIDLYSEILGQPASVNRRLDLDGDGTIALADHDQLIERFLQTSNGVGSLVGDINLDGRVTVLEDGFTLVLNLNVLGEAGYASGDLNADGRVNVLGDAFRLVANLGLSASASDAARQQ
jgi:hypothetical protein